MEKNRQKLIITIIAIQEIKSASRNRTFLISSLLLSLILMIAFVCGYANYNSAFRQREQAQKVINEEWQHQNRNPHAAAHWGTYLFKPYPFISIYEPGLTNYTGNYYRVEAHKQHAVNAVALADKEAFMRIPDLSIAFMLQVLMPLLIVFQAFSCITKERESQTLRLLLAQGVSQQHLLWGKLWGNYLTMLLIISVTFFLMLIGLFLDPGHMLHQLESLVLLFLTYAGYLFVVTAVVVLVSFYCRSSRSSLITSVSIWIVFIVLLPRLTTSMADRMYPLPSGYQFEHSVKVGFDKGLGHDGNYVERADAYLSTFLRTYHVDSISQLPKNIAFGLDLLNSELYMNKVYRYYSAQIQEKIAGQQRISNVVGFINPLMATRQLSMGLAGTDFDHHIDFYQHAQGYRNEFNEILNKKVLEQKEDNPDQNSLMEQAHFFKTMKPFNYHYPGLLWSLKCHVPAIVSLLLWLSLCVLVYVLSANRKFSRI